MTHDIFPSATLPIDGTELRWVDNLPERLPDAISLGTHLQAKPNELLVSFPQVARYHVVNGRLIEIALLSQDARGTAEFFLMATPFGALIHQRGELPLHASAVIPPHGDSALIIAGDSGAGKSTIAAALAKRGWAVLNDDVSRVCIVNGEAIVYPGFNALKLWQQSCDLLDLDSAALAHTRGKKQKYFWRPDAIHRRPAPIAAIVELKYIGNHDEPGKIQQERGGDAMQLLLRQTFRPRLIRPLGGQMNHFTQMQRIAMKHPCYQIANNHNLSPEALADRLETLIK